MKERKRKVLFIPAWYPSRVDPLAGIFTERHAQAVKEMVSVSVLYICGDENLETWFKLEKTNENGIPIIRVFFKKGSRRGLSFKITYLVGYITSILWGYYKAEKLFGRPDLIHVHVLTRTAILPMLMSLFRNIPYVITEHWTRYLPEDNSYKGWLRKKLTRLAVNCSKGVSCVSKTLENSMKNHGLQHSNYMQISNVVDTDLFKYEDHRQQDNVRFIHVSSFDPYQKNVKGIVDAAFQADQVGYQFELYLIGGGKEKVALENYVKQFSWRHVKVFFTGELYHDQLVKYYSVADAFILFSRFENQPCVILEAFSCGVPVIGTNSGGTPELLTKETGLIVPPEDIKALRDNMIKFINGEVNFDKKYIREKALNEYSYEAVKKQFKEFYNTVVFKS